MINAGKEFSDITFEHPAWNSPILTDLPGMFSKSLYSPVGSFVDPTGIRVVNKVWFKDGIEMFHYCMMQNPISNQGFVDVPYFRILDEKWGVSGMFVRSIYKNPVKPPKIVFQITLKDECVSPMLFANSKFPPRNY